MIEQRTAAPGKDSLYELAVYFFNNIQNHPQGNKELKRFNKYVQFEIVDGQSFYIHIDRGNVTVNKGIFNGGKADLVHFSLHSGVMEGLLRGKLRFSDVFSRYTNDRNNKEKVIPVSGMAGGTFGGPHINWVAKLIRMAQEVR